MKPQLPLRLRSGLIAIGLAAGLCAPATAGPSGFMAPPVQPAEAGSPSSDVIQIQNRSRRWMRRGGGNWSGRNFSRRGDWSGRNFSRRGDWSGRNWSRHGNWSGKRHWRGRHWNHGGHWNDWDDDWWGVGSGIILGLGALSYYSNPYWYGDQYVYSAPRRVYSVSSDHVAWCYNRWRSYRESDNSYQPYNGPRRQCRSPYG